jgi:hypothetical protein
VREGERHRERDNKETQRFYGCDKLAKNKYDFWKKIFQPFLHCHNIDVINVLLLGAGVCIIPGVFGVHVGVVIGCC